MTIGCTRVILTFIAFTASVPAMIAQTQQPAQAPAAPLPVQLMNAKRIFIANGAGDNDPSITRYTNGPDGLYNQFYADMKALGRFDLVSSSTDADVVLELMVDYAVFNQQVPYPRFRVEVRDSRSNVLLWSLSEPVNGAILAKSGRKNVAQALSKLADDLKKLMSSQ